MSPPRKSKPAVRSASAAANGAVRSQRREDMVSRASELFAQKGFRATTVREIADAAGILSGSIYHHFDSKESIGDEILAGFLNDVLADYRAAVSAGGDPADVLERIVRSSSHTLARHRAALTMLQNDWSYFSTQPRFAYLRKDLREIEQIWIAQLERGKAVRGLPARPGRQADLPAAARHPVAADELAAGRRLQHRPGGRRAARGCCSTASPARRRGGAARG